MDSPAPEQFNSRTHRLQEPCSGDSIPADCGVIEVHVRQISQLFDSLDPSPFHEKDLDRNAEEYIVESANELPTRAPCTLVLYVEQPAGRSDEERTVGDAIRVHFARRSRLARQELRRLIRRGWISLGIGLAFLAAVFLIAQTFGRLPGETALAKLSREGLLIVGWVAMWRPLELFLYDWWPIVGQRRVRDRLSRMSVRIISKASGLSGGQ